jgi:hypothetical protein
MRYFPTQIFAAIHEKDKSKPARHFSKQDCTEFKKLNEKGFGIYMTANSFLGGRKKENLLRLNAIVGDLDVAKNSENLSLSELKTRKQTLLDKLTDYCPPSLTVITKNGIQPWYFINETQTNDKTLKLFEGVACGLIDLTKELGSLGDEVKDVSRLWRLPGYLHQKSEPFEVTEFAGNNHTWQLLDLKDFFWREPQELKPTETVSTSTNPLWREMEKIDIRDIVIHAGKASGRKIEFGKDGHMILNGERRGTFIGTGGGFIATQSSVDPIKGNRITVVASMLKISNYKALQWICENFDKDPRWKLYG